MLEWREPIKIIAELLAKEMSLTPDRIFIYNDGRPLPKDDGLYIVLTINGTETYRNSSEFLSETETEVLKLNYKENIIVSVISKDSSARLRANEVIMALSSIYSQQLQEKYSCHIARISHLTDASFLEKTDMLTRFDISTKVLYWKKIEKSADYYTVENVESVFES